jgi:hypothetical protein
MESVKQPHKRVEKDGQWLSVAVERHLRRDLEQAPKSQSTRMMNATS